MRSLLLPRQSTNSPLDNRVPPMAGTSQVPDLKGIHREMHDIDEKIKIMNEQNARLVPHLATNNPSPAITPIPEDANRLCHSHRSSDQGYSQNHQNSSQGFLAWSHHYRSPSPHSRHGRQKRNLEKSQSRSSNRTSEELTSEGYQLAQLTVPIDTAVMHRLSKNSKIWMP